MSGRLGTSFVALLLVELFCDADGHTKNVAAGLPLIREKGLVVPDESGVPGLVLL